MNIASDSAPSSIMARIAKVRERMLIELATGIPASSKALFLPLCQHYEQRGEEKSFFSSYEKTHRPGQDLFPTNTMREDNGPRWYESALEHKARQWQKNSNDWEALGKCDDWTEWDDQ